jgi:hypothetical protein
MTGILANDGAFSFAMQEEMTQGATDSNIWPGETHEDRVRFLPPPQYFDGTETYLLP